MQLLDDLWNNKNFKIVDDCFSDDSVSKGTLGESAGKKEFKTQIVLPLFNAFPDLKYQQRLFCSIVLDMYLTKFFKRVVGWLTDGHFLQRTLVQTIWESKIPERRLQIFLI